MKVSLSKLAEREIDAAALFFEDRKEGFGGKFYRRVDEAIGKIELNPEGFRKVYKNLRRVQLEQFKRLGAMVPHRTRRFGGDRLHDREKASKSFQ